MRYSGYRWGGWMGGDYPVVRTILAINVAAFMMHSLAAFTVGDGFVLEHLALSPRIWSGEIWQLVTYMFLHSTQGPWHILFNMLAVWMFGKELETTWGSREFLKYYLVCGIGAGLTFLFFSRGVVIGASGAVFGILLAFGMTFPNQIILMGLLFPIKAKYMVLIYGIITFMSIARPSHDGIAHFAHLGGMVFGFLYLKKEAVHFLLGRLKPSPRKPRMKLREGRSRPSQAADRDENLRDKVDAILDKINAVGYEKLTAEEKQTLLEASKTLTESPRGPGSH